MSNTPLKSCLQPSKTSQEFATTSTQTGRGPHQTRDAPMPDNVASGSSLPSKDTCKLAIANNSVVVGDITEARTQDLEEESSNRDPGGYYAEAYTVREAGEIEHADDVSEFTTCDGVGLRNNIDAINDNQTLLNSGPDVYHDGAFMHGRASVTGGKQVRNDRPVHNDRSIYSSKSVRCLEFSHEGNANNTPRGPRSPDRAGISLGAEDDLRRYGRVYHRRLPQQPEHMKVYGDEDFRPSNPNGPSSGMASNHREQNNGMGGMGMDMNMGSDPFYQSSSGQPMWHSKGFDQYGPSSSYAPSPDYAPPSNYGIGDFNYNSGYPREPSMETVPYHSNAHNYSNPNKRRKGQVTVEDEGATYNTPHEPDIFPTNPETQTVPITLPSPTTRGRRNQRTHRSQSKNGPSPKLDSDGSPVTRIEYRPSRYSGGVENWGVGAPPKFINAKHKTDAALKKRGIKRGVTDIIIKRGYGATDPENLKIINLYDNNPDLTWEAIADEINHDRMIKGNKPTLTANGCTNRYNRNAPLIYASEGREFIPLSQRDANFRRGLQILPRIGWNDQLDLKLVEIVNEYDMQKWDTVARRFSDQTGEGPIDYRQAAMRHAQI